MKKRKKLSPEHRQHLSESMKRTMATPEFREKRSKVSKGMWSKPETRQHILTGILRTANDPKVRKRRSRSAKRRWAAVTPALRKVWIKNMTASAISYWNSLRELAPVKKIVESAPDDAKLQLAIALYLSVEPKASDHDLLKIFKTSPRTILRARTAAGAVREKHRPKRASTAK